MNDLSPVSWKLLIDTFITLVLCLSTVLTMAAVLEVRYWKPRILTWLFGLGIISLMMWWYLNGGPTI